MKKLLYVSVNDIWSGSEVLWYQSAKRFISEGHEVAFSTFYNNNQTNELSSLTSGRFDLNDRYESPLLNRIFNKFLKKKIKRVDKFLNFIKTFNPDYIIVSQGNNVAAIEYLNLFSTNKFKYFTITQLVTEFHWLLINNESLPKIQQAYKNSIKNFFVSKANIHLHNRMLGRTFSNSEVIYNPYHENSTLIKYPDTNKGYNIAFVGRVECFHKGLDVLVQVISNKKWQTRNISINIYGNGPHVDWLKQTIKTLEISNIYLNDFINNVADVWKENHILILPSRMEGQSLALLEAQMFGRAAIATNVGGASEIIKNGETGFLLDYPDALLLDSTLEIAWDAKDNWEQMGVNARRRMLEVYPDDVIKYFNDKISELLN